jgi:iron complex outermembrane receptor protein
MNPPRFFRLNPCAAAAAVCLLACWSAAQAQSAGSPAVDAQAAPAAAAPEKKSDVSQLSTVVVSGQRANGFSSAVVGVGAFRDQKPTDVPLTNSVITRDVMDAQGATSVMDAVRNTAGVTRTQLGASFYDNLAVRGIAMENRSSYRLDGSLPLVALVPIPVEDKERVEVLKGASSMYYGMVPPAGIVSFEMKRAGPKPVTSFSASANQWGAYTVAADIGRRFGEDDRFGLRVNALDGKDAPGLHNYDGKRSLLSAAFDFRATDNLSFKVDLEHYSKKATEQPAIQLIGTATVLPAAPNNRTNPAGEWAQTDAKADNGLIRMDWGFTDNWNLTMEYGEVRATRDRLFTQFAFNDISGYTTGVGRVFGNFNNGAYYKNDNGRIDLTGRLETGPVAHEITVGWTRNTRIQDTRGTLVQSWGCATISASCSVTSSKNVAQNLYNPIDVPLQVQTAPNGPQVTSIIDEGLYAVDRIILSQNWHVMLGLRRTDYDSGQTDPVITTPRYKTTQNSPNVSVIYKVTPDASLYASRLKGLESGAIVGQTFSNSGALLPAAETTQNELGGKIQLAGGTLFQVAYFDIRRAQTTSEPAPPGSSAPPGTPNAAPSTWQIQTQNGEVQFRGLEFAASGELTKNLGLVASAMFMDPQITRDSTLGASNVQGKIPGNTAKQTASVFAEYRFDGVPGLAVNGALYYTGERPVANTNNVFLPGVTTLSLGARYKTRLGSVPTVFQVNVDNATDKSYWSAADTTSANPLVSYALPRTIRLSATFDF